MKERKKIIIIEKNEVVRDFLTERLTNEGHLVEAVNEGEEGLRKVKEEIPDLVLLSAAMPGKSGLKVLEELKKEKDTSAIPVIMSSNSGDLEEIDAIKKLGANDYFIKTEFNIQETMGKIGKALDRKQEEQRKEDDTEEKKPKKSREEKGKNLSQKRIILEKKLSLLIKKEDELRLEKQEVEKKEESERDWEKVREIERKRWRVEDKRKDVEKKMWKVEDTIYIINKKIEKKEKEPESKIKQAEEESPKEEIKQEKPLRETLKEEIKNNLDKKENKEIEKEDEKKTKHSQKVIFSKEEKKKDGRNEEIEDLKKEREKSVEEARKRFRRIEKGIDLNKKIAISVMILFFIAVVIVFFSWPEVDQVKERIAKQEACMDKGFYWYQGECYTASEIGITEEEEKIEPGKITSQEKCEKEGFHWHEDSCYEELEPIDGGWSEWSAWGECKTERRKGPECGYVLEHGEKTRTRTCDNPEPDYGGEDCQGPSEEEISCIRERYYGGCAEGYECENNKCVKLVYRDIDEFCTSEEHKGMEMTIDGQAVYCDSNLNLWTPTLSLPAEEVGTSQHEWGCYGETTGAYSSSDGKSNTKKIMAANCSHEDAAGNLCDNLQYLEQTNWHLPAINTLKGLYSDCIKDENKNYGEACSPGWDENAVSNYYWSSTEFSAERAKRLNFFYGSVFHYDKSFNHYHVRCVLSR